MENKLSWKIIREHLKSKRKKAISNDRYQENPPIDSVKMKKSRGEGGKERLQF